MLEKVYQETYKKLILEVDALDNGVSCADDMLYSVKTGLGSRVGRYNTNWNAPKSTSQHEQFKKAMKVCEEEFLWALKGTVMVKLPAYGIVKKAFEDRKNFHPSGEIMQMEGGACPWKEHLLDLEADSGCKGEVKFLVTQDARKMWRVVTVPPKPNSFEQRVPICRAWRGLRGTELQKVSGIADTEFVHMACFTGGAWSKASAVKMCELSIKEFKESEGAKE